MTGRIRRIVFIAAGGILAVPMLLNLFYGELSGFGSLILLFSLFLLLLPFCTGILKKLLKGWYRVLAAAGLIAVCVLVAGAVFMTCVMLRGAKNDAQNAGPGAPVVVLGCLIHGDQPGKMLQNRLDAALAYLEENTGAVCVVCGGKTGDYTQAQVMERYLVEKGVQKERILVDDRSDTTFQNLKNAKELLGGPTRVVIATDAYHQYRAGLYAKKLGLTPYSLVSKTPPRHLIDSWAREYAAVLKAWLIGR